MGVEVINMFALYQLRGWLQFVSSLFVGGFVAFAVLFVVWLILKK